MTVYKIEDFHQCNCPDFLIPDSVIQAFFHDLKSKSTSNLHHNRDVRTHYPNKHNVQFNRRRRPRPQVLICTDPETIKRIRSILSKISPKTYDILKEQLCQFITDSTVPHIQIADVIYGNLIDNIFIADLFIRLMKHIEQQFPKIIYYIHQAIIHQAKEPRVFEKDTFSETATDKSKRWMVSNGILITQLRLKGKYSEDFYLRLFSYWLWNSPPENTRFLEIIVKILPLLKKKHLNTEILEKLNSIVHDKSYPGRIRFLLEIKD